MRENPYESPATSDARPRTQGTKWALWSGIACLVAAGLCFVLTIVMMASCFDTFGSAPATPRPEDLANGIARAMIPAYGVLPLGLLGIVLIVVGLVVRRPVDK